MRTVQEVLDEIKDWDKQYNALNNMRKQMEEDINVSHYVKTTFGLSLNEVEDMARRAMIQRGQLQSALDKCQVDI